MKNIYLDHAATTPLSDSMKEYLTSILDMYGNPSSLYSLGEKSKQIISQARQSVAKFINADTKDIYFTSGGSASNTLGIRGYFLKHDCTLFYSPIAHKSVLKCVESFHNSHPLKVDSEGFIDIHDLEEWLDACINQPFVIIDHANSEIGTIQDIETIIKIVHSYNGVVYLDCTGSIPQIPIDVKKFNIDMLGFSAHKLGGLKGCGVLYKRPNIELEPLVYGKQESGLVGGTENVLGIASLGKAVEKYNYSSITSENRDYVWNYIKNNIPEAYLVGSPLEEHRLPKNLNICFPKCEGESLMLLLDMNGIQVSTGSACSSGDLTPSITLSAIGMNKEDIHSCIRMSFGEELQEAELQYIGKTLSTCVQQLRNLVQIGGDTIPKKRTHDEFIELLKNVNSNIVVLGRYNGSKTKILCSCNIDKYEWEALPLHLLKGHGCPKCAGKIKTQDEFIKELSIKNPNIGVLDNYINATTKIKCRCRKCNKILFMTPNALLSGKGCYDCNMSAYVEKITKTHDQFILDLNNRNDSVKILGKYRNAKTNILTECKKCGYIWNANPDSLLHETKCPKCAKVAHKTHDEFLNELKSVNPNIVILGNYINSKSKVLCMCNICGFKWETTPDALINQKTGCPKCNKSHGEKYIEKYLTSRKIYYIPQKTFNGLTGIGNGKLSYDFYLPTYNLLIEFQGMQHEKPIDFNGKGMESAKENFKKQQEHDKRKRKYAQEHNIDLLEIWYYEIDSIDEILSIFYLKKLLRLCM